MHDISAQDMDKIVAFCHKDGADREDLVPESYRCGVIDHYVSDSPSWCGKLIVAVGGEACFLTIFYFDKQGEIERIERADTSFSDFNFT